MKRRAGGAGDTGWGGHFAQIGERFRNVSLALLPIDAFELEGEGDPVHISPAEALRAHQVLDAWTSMAIHFGMYPLSKEAPRVLERRLAEQEAALGSAPPFWILDFGESRPVPPRPTSAAASSVPAGTRLAR